MCLPLCHIQDLIFDFDLIELLFVLVTDQLDKVTLTGVSAFGTQQSYSEFACNGADLMRTSGRLFGRGTKSCHVLMPTHRDST